MNTIFLPEAKKQFILMKVVNVHIKKVNSGNVVGTV